MYALVDHDIKSLLGLFPSLDIAQSMQKLFPMYTIESVRTIGASNSLNGIDGYYNYFSIYLDNSESLLTPFIEIPVINSKK